MEDTFKSFCAFGSGATANVHTMDNAKFAKFSRDKKVLDKKLTATDIDIIFSKVKVKSERKITYEQFREGLKLMAEKKYPGDAESLAKLEKVILESSGPKTSKTTKASKTNVVDRLTDTTKYTGSHKERFDESGKGRGIDGRREMDSKASQGYVGAYKGKDTYDKKH